MHWKTTTILLNYRILPLGRNGKELREKLLGKLEIFENGMGLRL
jgi:hypothetical protein